jgi:YVTN family beta-propeller protein
MLKSHVTRLLLGLVVVSSIPTAAGTLVVANKSEATVSLVDTDSGEIRATLPTGEAPHEVAISPDGRLALVGNYGTRAEPGSTLTLIDVESASVVKTVELAGYSRPHGIVWRDNSRAVVTVEANRALITVDTDTGEVVQEVATEAEVSHMVALAPGQTRAFVANIGSGSVTAVDLESGERLETITTGEGAEGITVTPDGRQVWVTNRAADTVTVLDAKTLKPVVELEAGSFPIRAEATADGRWILVTNARGNDLSVFSTQELTEVHRVPFAAVSKDAEGRLFSDRFGESSVPIGIEVVSDNKVAYVAHANADDISIIDLEDWKVIGTLAAGREPDGMGYSSRTSADGE